MRGREMGDEEQWMAGKEGRDGSPIVHSLSNTHACFTFLMACIWHELSFHLWRHNNSYRSQKAISHILEIRAWENTHTQSTYVRTFATHAKTERQTLVSVVFFLYAFILKQLQIAKKSALLTTISRNQQQNLAKDRTTHTVSHSNGTSGPHGISLLCNKRFRDRQENDLRSDRLSCRSTLNNLLNSMSPFGLSSLFAISRLGQKGE